MKTLSVFTGGIGDLLLAGPAFAFLHYQGQLDLAGNPERLALIQAADACDKVYDLDRIDFHTVFDKPSEKLCEFIQQYDRIIVWMRDDGAIQQALRECGVLDVQVFPGIPPEDWRIHASDYYWSCIDAALIKPRPPFRITKWEGEAPAEPKYDIIIHPGSGSPKKNWPIENFVAVAEHLRKADRRITWIRGPAEEDLHYPVDAEIIESACLSDLAKRFAAMNLYIGNDSGISHLAAAVGCKTVAVFGPTDPKTWAPRGDQVCIVADNPWPTQKALMEALGMTFPLVWNQGS